MTTATTPSTNPTAHRTPTPDQPQPPFRAKVSGEVLSHTIARYRGMAASKDWAPGVRQLAERTAELLRELLERRLEDVTTRGVERTMAYEHASGLIDGEALPATRNGEADYDWIDLASARDEAGELSEYVEEAVAYLDSRGLIERDAEHPGWISIRDESEAWDIQMLAECGPALPEAEAAR